jgi:hypothetical protein
MTSPTCSLSLPTALFYSSPLQSTSTSIQQRKCYHYQHSCEQNGQTAKGGTEKKYGEELTDKSEGFKLWSLKALLKVTKMACDCSTGHVSCHLAFISALGIVFLSVILGILLTNSYRDLVGFDIMCSAKLHCDNSEDHMKFHHSKNLKFHIFDTSSYGNYTEATEITCFPIFLCSCIAPLFTKMLVVITDMIIFTSNLHIGLADICQRSLEANRISGIWEASRTITGLIILAQYTYAYSVHILFGYRYINNRQYL